jgi:hypothetical protein
MERHSTLRPHSRAGVVPFLETSETVAAPAQFYSTKWKRGKVRNALIARARRELGAGATPVDYVCSWVSKGGRISTLANEIADEIGESCSPSFLTFINKRLAPNAKERITSTRREFKQSRTKGSQGKLQHGTYVGASDQLGTTESVK